MSNGNAQHRILGLLDALDGPITRKTIANQLGLSPTTIADALTPLKAGGFLNETKGQWTITPEGRELHKSNQFFSPKVIQPPKESRRVFWLEHLDWNYIEQNPLCRYIFSLDDDSLAWLHNNKNKLMPFILLSIAAIDKLPTHNFTNVAQELEGDDREFWQAFIDYLNK